MKKFVLAFALVLGMSSAASAGTVIDQLVWEASPVQQERLIPVLPKMNKHYSMPDYYSYDERTKLCFAKARHSSTVVPCTDLVIEQIVKDWVK